MTDCQRKALWLLAGGLPCLLVPYVLQSLDWPLSSMVRGFWVGIGAGSIVGALLLWWMPARATNLLAVAMIGLATLAMSAYALSGAALSRRMREPRFRRGFNIFVGVLLLTAAVLIAMRL